MENTVENTQRQVSEQVKVVAYSIPLVESTNSLRILLKGLGKDATKNLDERIIIALDRSGSMGSVIRPVAHAAVQMIRDLYDVKKTQVSLIAYNSEVSWKEFTPDRFQLLAPALLSISAGGMTSFTMVLGSIISYLGMIPDTSPVTIFWFTDGHDTCSSKSQLEGAMKVFQETVNGRSGRVRLVCLGFRSDHDANFLTQLSKIGSHEGFFTYAENVNNLGPCLDMVKSVALTHTVDGTIHWQVNRDGKIQDAFKSITLLPIRNTDDAEGFTFLPPDATNIRVDLKIGEDCVQMPLDIQKVKLEDVTNDVLAEQRLSYVSELVKTSASENDGKLARKAHTILGETRMGAFQVRPREKRRDILQRCVVMVDVVDKLLRAFAKGANARLDNTQLANVADLAYRSGTWKSAIKRKLDVRADKNADLFNKMEKRVENIVSKVDFAKLREENETPNLDTCFCSCMNWIEALEDGDCLGIALDIARNEIAIMDPSKLLVRAIRPSFITASSFIDSVEYAVNHKGDIGAHGGFDKQRKGELVVGQARERITGMMPLYFNYKHWLVAKERSKPVYGWMTTTSPLGYAPTQITTIPFLVMAKASLNKTTSGKRIFELIFRTCRQIYKDFKIKDFMSSIFEQYVYEPGVRTIDSVPDNSIFLAQLFCAFQEKDLEFKTNEDKTKFFMTMIEEDLRRRVPAMCENSDIFSFFGIDAKTYVLPRVQKELNDSAQPVQLTGELQSKVDTILQSYPDAFASMNDVYTNPFCSKNEAGALDKDQEEDGFAPFWEKSAEYRIPQATKDIVGRVETAYEFVRTSPIPKLLALLGVTEGAEVGDKYFKLKDFPGMDNQFQKMSFAYQTMTQAKNADRRQAIAKGKYEFFLQPDYPINEYLETSIKAALEKCIAEQISDVRTKREAAMREKAGALFATTDNIVLAVALIKGRYHGANLRSFWMPLQTQDCPLALEKLEMLLSGTYKGIPLLCDKYSKKSNSEEPVEWYPDQKNSRRFWYRNGYKKMSVDAWIIRFPQTAQHMSARQAE